MKYNFIVRPYPHTHSFTLFAGQGQLLAAIAQEKRVTLDVWANTKATVGVSVCAGEARLRASYIPEGCEHLKFHSTSGFNVWPGCGYDANYFKILRKQKWSEFKEYLTALLNSLHIPCEDSETIEVNVEMKYDVKEKLEAPEYVMY